MLTLVFHNFTIPHLNHTSGISRCKESGRCRKRRNSMLWVWASSFTAASFRRGSPTLCSYFPSAECLLFSTEIHRSAHFSCMFLAKQGQILCFFSLSWVAPTLVYSCIPERYFEGLLTQVTREGSASSTSSSTTIQSETPLIVISLASALIVWSDHFHLSPHAQYQLKQPAEAKGLDHNTFLLLCFDYS